MANETITFYCPACGIKLTVPASLAGVTGPCPSCRTQIQAPIPAAPPVQQIPAPPAYQSPPVQQIPVAPAYQTPPVSYAPTGMPATPPPQQASVYQEPPPVHAAPPVLKPEPRQLPNSSHPEEVVARQMPAGNGQPLDPKKLQPAPLPRHPHRTSPLVRFSLILLFLIAAVVLVYGVLKILNMEPGKYTPIKSSQLQTASSDKPLQAVIETKPVIATPLPTPPTEQPVLSEPPPKLPDGIEPKLPGVIAAEVLEKFLTAKSLAERLPMIETKTPEAELAQSCLAGPLPAFRNLAIDVQESNPVEEVVDFYYNVDFEAGDNRINPQTILVRTRGNADPKVVVDPFLDIYGGRLAAYAAKTSDKGGTFQVIVYAVASCTNENIREREKKLTLKLLARDNTKEIAQAYFSKVSKIGEMLQDGTYSLSYGKAKACTVMLRWNTEENKDHPYLEAIGLKALDWNP